ncbi:MAG: hypothetical protein Q9218_003763 [Villophora microphyllina]
MTEDDIYRTSTQYRLWSFTPESLASLRATTNATAAESVKAAIQSLKMGTDDEKVSQDGQVDLGVGVDCLTIEEEQKIVSYYCLQTLALVDHCKYPTNVKATAVQYLKRFYLTNSPMTYHPKEIMPTAVYLAMKSEDNFQYVKSFAEHFDNISMEDILAPEFLLTQGLRFTFDVRHPFRGLEGGFMELLAFANGKGQAGPLIKKSPIEIRNEMLGLAPPPWKSTKTGNVKELITRIEEGVHGKAKEILKTSALLTDAYFLYSPSQIWLSTLLLVDEPLARFYLDTKIPARSDMKIKLFTVLQSCADMLRSSPAAQPDKEEKKGLKRIDKKLAQCRNPQKMDLVGMNKAQKRDPEQSGGTGLDEQVAKRRKLEREKSLKEGEDLFGPAIAGKGTLSAAKMAKPDVPIAKPVNDLDDMLYPSDEEDVKKTAINPEEVKEPATDASPGMIAKAKNLYPSEEDDRGRFTMTDKPPADVPEPEETEETARYALLIRNRLAYGKNKGLSITSIVIQSPLLKKVLRWVLKDYPCMAPELDRLEVVAPFRPFIHRWERLTDALNNERDPETKSHIQLFYDALKEELALSLEARDDFIAHKTITFNSLWNIFEPGTIVFTTVNKRHVAAKLKTTSIYAAKHEDIFQLECEMIYANGEKLGWGHHRFDIPEFGGMCKIYDLPVYPLQYHRKVDKITKELVENGKKYQQMMGFHHKQYQGVALDSHQPFYVDSRIIIDAKAFMCYNPDRDMVLRPLKKQPKTHDSYGLDTIGEDLEQSDSSSDEDDVGNTKATDSQPQRALTNEELMLCGSAVKGYSLRNKRWLDFFVDSIHDIDWKPNAWDDVVLEEDQKDLIFSMTDGHRSNHQGLQTKGLNILLSGPTGVGKTFAVESLAEHLRAPLFHVTPADVDLDTKNPDLESPFTDMLEMCGKWNAILLVDEEHKALDSDDIDDKEGNYSLLLRALESHSNAFFVTCNTPAEDSMDDRLQSRFHVCLEFPELNAATREQIWQKCLESHKDVKFFDNFKALGQWTLNGREIANAVTAAKTLIKGGTMEMKHLERVVAAHRQITLVEEEYSWWETKPKDKKKKSKKPVSDAELPPPPSPPPEVIEIVEPAPKKADDDWCDWGQLSSKPKKSKKKKVSADEEAQPKEDVVAIVEEPPTVNGDEFDVWGFGSKKDKKKKRVIIDEDEEVQPRVEPTPIVEDPPKFDDNPDDVWGFAPNKDKKKKGVKSAETIEDMSPMSVQEESHKAEAVGEVVPQEDLDWGFWGAKTKKKSNKTSKAVDNLPPILPSPGTCEETIEAAIDLDFGTVAKGNDDDNLGWGSFGTKKEKKAKADSPTEVKEPAPSEDKAVEELAPAPAQPEVDEWDFWASARNKKKKGKKAVVEEPVPVPEAAQPEVTAPQENEVVVMGECQTCAAPEPVIPRQYCKHCGTLEGERKIVCKPCAAIKGTIHGITRSPQIVSPSTHLISLCPLMGPRPHVVPGRSPCPHLNTLANHGYLPRDGLNISVDQFVTALKDAFNFDAAVTVSVASAYLNFSTTGSTNTLNLNDLDHHFSALAPLNMTAIYAAPAASAKSAVPGEFDGSLSRNDLYFGDNYSFNKTIWDATVAHFRDDTISIADAARARKDRIADAEAVNPYYTPSNGSVGTTALYLLAMRDQYQETKTKYVDILFREERLPFFEGFQRSNVSISLDDVGRVSGEIVATS